MLWTLIWILGVAVGYAIFMSQTPLRSYFSDGLGLVRERGSSHLWLAVGMLSLIGAGADLWRQYDLGGSFAWGSPLTAPELQHVAAEIPVRAIERLGDLFSTFVAGGTSEIGGGVRGVMVGLLGSLLMVTVALVLQYYVMLFLYVRLSSPSKRIRFSKLMELSLRRFGRTWPMQLLCLAVWAMPVVGGVSEVFLVWWTIAAALFFVIFGFVQVGVLSGERDLKAVVLFNFKCWREGALQATWFLVIALANLFVFVFGEVVLERTIDPGSFPGIVLKIVFVFAGAFVLVWLSASWLLLFCDRFIGSKQPRPK